MYNVNAAWTIWSDLWNTEPLTATESFHMKYVSVGLDKSGARPSPFFNPYSISNVFLKLLLILTNTIELLIVIQVLLEFRKHILLYAG